MLVELIPVIEIVRYNDHVPMPEGPYWDNRKEWDEYRAVCLEKAGFPDKMMPYSPGSVFFRFNDISDANLKKVVLDQTEKTREEDYEWEEEGYGRSFYGGYVLRVDGEDKYFPQCCCDLSYIRDWESLLTDKRENFYAGHPSPTVKLNDGILTFDFTITTPVHESFADDVPDKQLSVDMELLRQALANAKIELNEFGERLIRLNETEKLGIPNIDKYLIWYGQHL